jgi:hypothetical protein
VIVLAGTGRTADAIAAAFRQPSSTVADDDRAARIARSRLVSVVSVADADAVSTALELALSRGSNCP